MQSPHNDHRDDLEPSWPTTAELVILCAFGKHLSDRPSGSQLRQALTAAGFRPAEARQIVRTSLLLERHQSDTYVLRPGRLT